MGERAVENRWKDSCGGMKSMCGRHEHKLGVWKGERYTLPIYDEIKKLSEILESCLKQPGDKFILCLLGAQ